MVCAEPMPAIVQIKSMQMTLGDLIRTDHCYEAISLEMSELLTPNVQRIKTHVTILDLVTQCVRSFDPTLKVHPFGSNVYGFSGSNTNNDILIDTRKYSTKILFFLINRTFDLNFMQENRKSHRRCYCAHSPSTLSQQVLNESLSCQIKSIQIAYESNSYRSLIRRLASYVICCSITIQMWWKRPKLFVMSSPWNQYVCHQFQIGLMNQMAFI